MNKFKKGEVVYIAKGKDRGKTGKVLSVYPEISKLIIEGINIKRRHVRPKRMGQKGETVEVPGRVPFANVLAVCKSCKKATRVGFKSDEGGKKRFCRKCGAEL